MYIYVYIYMYIHTHTHTHTHIRIDVIHNILYKYKCMRGNKYALPLCTGAVLPTVSLEGFVTGKLAHSPCHSGRRNIYKDFIYKQQLNT